MKFISDIPTKDINTLINLWNKISYNTSECAKEFAVFDIDSTLFVPTENKKTITFGMSQNAMVTASSIENDGFLCCIQKDFINSEGKTIEQSEFFVPSYGYDINTTLCAAAANLIINGIFL